MNTILQAFLSLSGEGNSFYAQKFKRTVSYTQRKWKGCRWRNEKTAW